MLSDNQSCCNNPSCCEPSNPYKRGYEKVGRNSPCPCGSGRKFKKCCGI
ncbi:MAG: zinc chelation protein SecC [Crocinitomicaceae bacterium]|nr:zinc chelation protein SecC [Crocinitomicaceae bacterium]